MHFEGCTQRNPRLLLWKELNMMFQVCKNLLHDNTSICVLKLA